MIRHLARVVAIVAATTITTPVYAGGLNLTIDGVRNANGSVLVLVFDNETAFNQLNWNNAVQYADIPARKGRVSHSFPGLTAGPYAILVIHDENGDQDLNFSGQRLLEGVGASGPMTPTFETTFAEAAVPPGNVTLRVFYGE